MRNRCSHSVAIRSNEIHTAMAINESRRSSMDPKSANPHHEANVVQINDSVK